MIKEMLISNITVNEFEKHLHQKIDIFFSETAKLEAEILEITYLMQNNLTDRQPFSVVFRTEQRTEYYQQGNFVMQIPCLPPFHIFLVPLGFDEKGMKYEAIYN